MCWLCVFPRRISTGGFVSSKIFSFMYQFFSILFCDELAHLAQYKFGTIQRRLAWPLRKDDTFNWENSNNLFFCFPYRWRTSVTTSQHVRVENICKIWVFNTVCAKWTRKNNSILMKKKIYYCQKNWNYDWIHVFTCTTFCKMI